MLLENLDDAVERGFRFEISIKEQRMIGAIPGEVVQPALAVVEIPEAHTLDGISVLRVDGEELGVLLRLCF